MKNTIKNFLLSATALFLTCSFAESPAAYDAATTGKSARSEMPVGGVYVVFAGKYGGEITKKEMTGQRELRVEGCHKDSKIVKFTLEVTKGGKTTSLQAESNVLTQEMLTKLNALSPGDKFEFKNSRAYLSDNKVTVDARGSKFVVV
ncbi:MAG: hypothetical protein HY842_20395 [Bacteroidetes bacterium]|nr:hypothetical protein [Bacteroidota bacterium]